MDVDLPRQKLWSASLFVLGVFAAWLPSLGASPDRQSPAAGR